MFRVQVFTSGRDEIFVAHKTRILSFRQARRQQNPFGGALDRGRGAHAIEAPSRDAEGVELRGAIGAENRDAEGVEGVGNGEGVSPPQPTRESGGAS